MDEAINKLYFEMRQRLEREMEEAFGRLWRAYVWYPAVAGSIEIPSPGSIVGGSPQYWRPPTDVFETQEEFILRLEIAGLNRESLRISQSADGRRLWLLGERREQSRSSSGRQWYHQLEIYFGPFELSWLLPPGVYLDLDQVKASYHQGILLVKISKKKEHGGSKKKGFLIIPIE